MATDPNNFSFTLDGFTFDMIDGTLFSTGKLPGDQGVGARTEHYAFEYTGPPLYALARAWAAHLEHVESLSKAETKRPSF